METLLNRLQSLNPEKMRVEIITLIEMKEKELINMKGKTLPMLVSERKALANEIEQLRLLLNYNTVKTTKGIQWEVNYHQSKINEIQSIDTDFELPLYLIDELNYHERKVKELTNKL